MRMIALGRLAGTLLSLLVVAAVALPAAPVEAATAASKCQAAIGKAGRKLTKTHLGAWRVCLDSTLDGKSCDASTRDTKISAGVAKFRSAIVAKCPNAALFTVHPDGLGFPSSCDLAPEALDVGGCSARTVNDAQSLADCLACWRGAESDHLLRVSYPCPAGAAPAAGGLTCGSAPATCPDSTDEARCAKALANAGLLVASARTGAIGRCLDAAARGDHSGPCPDSKGAEKISAAEAKAAKLIGKCTSAPPWWSHCPRGVAGVCGAPLSSTAEIATCELAVAGSVATELLCQQYPGASSAGLACPTDPPPTTTSTTTSTTTTSTTSTTLGPTCGNLMLDLGEDCDPPGSTCAGSGVCDSTCSCNTSAPLITGITPPEGSIGTILSIAGQRFGNDRSAVFVRFHYEEGGETLESTVPVLDVAPTLLRVPLPLAAGGRTNDIEVVVASVPSNTFPYLVGDYPWDPTPGAPGSEADELMALLDELLIRFNAKLDAWFVDTGALPPHEAAELHVAATQIRDRIAAFRAALASEDDETRRIVDALLSTPMFDELHDLVQQAVDALHGSPFGEILCEAQKVVEVLGDILIVLDVIQTVLDIIITTLVVACGASILLAIVTLGALGPLAALICGGGVVAALEILRTINSILGACATAISVIVAAAPTTPIDNTWRVSVQHSSWAGEPAFVYVAGSPAVLATSVQDFHNVECEIVPCDLDFTVSVFEVPVPVHVPVPYVRVHDAVMDTDLAFPAGVGGPGFHAVPGGGEGISGFTGADVNGPAHVRGNYSVTYSSDCTDRTGLLGSETRSYEVVAGPMITSFGPNHAQLGGRIEVCADYVPPIDSMTVDFGDNATDVTRISADCFEFTVPDTTGADPVRVSVNGTEADMATTFSVDPPILTAVTPETGFVGERVRLSGSGFARDASNNMVTLSGVSADIVSAESNKVVIEIPEASSGNIVLTAMGTFVSNPRPFGVLRWSSPTTQVSHSSRDASLPVISTTPEGSVGVIWIDRPSGGGAPRLLFADITDGDPAFRAPIEISTSLATIGSSPLRVALAGDDDDLFHVSWVDSAGDVRVATIPAGASTGTSIVVAAASVSYAWQDVAIAAMRAPSDVVRVEFEGVPLSGDPALELFAALSTDAAMSFAAPASYAGPTAFLDAIDLATGGGRLVRAFRDNPVDEPGIFTQVSNDGITFDAKRRASSSGEDGALPQRVDVSVFSNGGAIVAWESPSGFGIYQVNADRANYGAPRTLSGPLLGESAMPQVVVDSNNVTSLVWVSRVAGNSPDALPGVPRVLFSRSLDRLVSFTTEGLQPTVAPGDIDTVDSWPSLAVGSDNRLHLVWLEGTADARTLRYAMTTTGTTGPADTAFGLGDNPAAVLDPPVDIIAAALGRSTVEGHLVLEPDRNHALRWLQTGMSADFREGGPSLRSDLAGLLHTELGAPSVWDFAEERNPLFLDVLEQPEWSPDPLATGTRAHLFFGMGGAVSNVLPKILLGSGPLRVATLGVEIGETDFAYSATGRYAAFVQYTQAGAVISNRKLVVHDRNTAVSTVVFTGGCADPTWSPVVDRLVFACESGLGMSLFEWVPAGSVTAVGVSASDQVRMPRFSPDGTDIAYQWRDLSTDPWTISLLSGSSVPAAVDRNDTAAVWSPTGDRLLFVRSTIPDMVLTFGTSSELATWMPGEPSVTPLTDLPDDFALRGSESNCEWEGNLPPCFEGGPQWTTITP